MSIAHELQHWFAVEWSPLGAVTFAPLMEVLHRNHETCLAGGNTEKRIVLLLLVRIAYRNMCSRSHSLPS